MWPDPYNHNLLNPPGQGVPARPIYEQHLGGRTSSPINNNSNPTMAPSGLDPFASSPSSRVVDIPFSSHPSQNQSSSTSGKMAAGSKDQPNLNATSKATIDPRAAAAVLKEKLLKSKEQRAVRDKPLEPLGEVSHNTGRPEKRSLSQTAAASTFVPHAVAHMPPQNSINADSDDIAALIKSISSASNGQAVKTNAPTTEPRLAGPTISNALAIAGISPSAVRAVQKIPGLGGPRETPAGRDTQDTKPSGTPSSTKNGEIINHKTPNAGTALVRPVTTQAVNTGSETPKHNDNQAPAPTGPSKWQGRNILGLSPGTASNTLSAALSKEKQHRAGSVSDTYSPPQNISPANDAKNAKTYPSTGQPTATGKPGKADNDSNSGGCQTLGATLANLISHDQDLRDWLIYTQYFDVEARNKKLTRYRKLAEMDAAEQKIKDDQERLAAERRKLLEEDDLDRSLFPYMSQTGQSQTLQAFAPATPSTSISTAKQTVTSQPGGDPTSMKPSTVLKRAIESDDTEQRTKMQKLDTDDAKDRKTYKVEEHPPHTDRGRSWERGKDLNYRNTYRPRSRSNQRDGPYRRQSPRRDSHSRYSDDYNDEDYDRGDHGRYDGYRGRGKRGGRGRTPSPRGRYGRLPVVDPKPVDLGGKGETRFFILKSFNEENVRHCMDDGLWTTQSQNAETLTTAFAQCKNVILLFSINKSRAFQGYARMTTAPSPDTPRPSWIKGIHWEASPPFRVEWLSTTEVEFYHIGHLRNKLNEDLPVLVGKDGQEIEEGCGRRLLEEMEPIIRSKQDHLYRDPGRGGSPRGYRGRGGINIRGRGRYVKREER